MGHDMSQAFPSKYLKAADLGGKQVPVTISHVEFEEVAKDEANKPVLYFEGRTKGMVINKTNNDRLCGAFGYQSDEWAGKEIFLYTEMTQFEGRSMPGLRVSIPLPVADETDDLPF